MQKSIIALLMAACLLLGVGTIVLYFSGDRTAPVIRFQEGQVSFSQEDDPEVLLKGVTAEDDQDGDVTQNLLVENIYIHKETHTATVVYVAKDKANNIAKVNREVQYRELPVEPNSESETEPETESETEPVTESETEMETESESEDNWELERPKMQLKTDAVTIAVGQAINRLSYVDSVSDDKDTTNDLWTRIHIDGDAFDYNIPGVYKQVYYVVDSDGNRSERHTLTITVQ